MLEIIKAGIKLRKRVAGTTIYVRGMMTTDDQRQFLIQEEIATLQIGLDQPGWKDKQILASIGDGGLVLQYWWNGDRWRFFPKVPSDGIKATLFMQVPVASTPASTSSFTQIPIYHWQEQKYLTYRLRHTLTTPFTSRVGDVISHWQDLTNIEWHMLEVFREDIPRYMIPGADITTYNTSTGVIEFRYPNPFEVPNPEFVYWSGSNAGILAGGMGGYGQLPSYGFADVFR